MKRKLKKMSLRTETLLSLEDKNLRQAGGGASEWSHAMWPDSGTCTYGVHEGEEIIVYF